MKNQTAELANILRSFTKATNPEQTAETLLNHFGTLPNVLEAPEAAIAKVTTAATAAKIAAIIPAFRAYTSAKAETPEEIRNRRMLEQHCHGLLDGKRVEEFWVICVNAQCQLVGERRISTGSLAEVSAYPRLVMETALNYNAHSVFFTHNHPGGTCSPSAEDIASTIQLKNLLSGVGILVLDHVIISKPANPYSANAYSMAEHGDVNFAR